MTPLPEVQFSIAPSTSNMTPSGQGFIYSGRWAVAAGAWGVYAFNADTGAYFRYLCPVTNKGLNVPPAILGRGGVAYAITQAGLMDVAPQLVLEVTEQDIPDKLGVQALSLAGRYGIHVALDDVGVADENLAVFARAHIDILEIDKSLVE
jgi:hypothetical protein